MFHLLAAILLVIATASAESAVFTPCENFANSCTIHEVRITPCSNPSRCALSKGQTTQLAFDFTPKFSAEKLQTGVYYVNQGSETGFADLDSNGCQYTSCPVEADKKQSFNYSLYVAKKIPGGLFPIRWKLWDEADPTNVCCFNTDIYIKKK